MYDNCGEMTDVEKSEIFLHKNKPVIHAVLSRNLFCHNLRAFMWGKIEPKSTFVEKK